MADRAMSPVVSKAMEATIVVLYIGLVTTTLYGGVVPEYRTTAGSEVAERTVADVATDVERAIPPESTRAMVDVTVSTPSTIAGDDYLIRAGTDRLVLEHPDPAVSTSIPLVLSDRVVNVSGTWYGSGRMRIHAETVDDGLEVKIG